MFARGERERLVLMRRGERNRGPGEMGLSSGVADVEVPVKARHHPVGHLTYHDPNLGHDGCHLEKAWRCEEEEREDQS